MCLGTVHYIWILDHWNEEMEKKIAYGRSLWISKRFKGIIMLHCATRSTSSLKKTVNCESGNMWNLCLCKNTKYEKDKSTITISMAHTYSVRDWNKYDWKSLCIVCTWMICQIQILRKGVLFIFKEICPPPYCKIKFTPLVSWYSNNVTVWLEPELANGKGHRCAILQHSECKSLQSTLFLI